MAGELRNRRGRWTNFLTGRGYALALCVASSPPDLTARGLHGSACLACAFVSNDPRHNLFLIDISNSFTKLTLASPKRIARPSRIATNKLTAAYLRGFIKLKRRKIDMFVVCSVVPKKNREVKSAARKTQILWLGPHVKLGVGIKYPSPKTIGADRLANAAAVAALYGAPAIVVDFGTAVTFDIVSAKKNTSAE